MIVIARKVAGFFIRIYIIVCSIHFGYMLACYNMAKPIDWLYFSVYGLSALVYKVVKNYR